MDITERKNAPVFVKVNEYQELLDILDVMKQKLKTTQNTLDKIKELKTQEDSEIREWEKSLGEVSKRIAFIDKTFFEDTN